MQFETLIPGIIASVIAAALIALCSCALRKWRESRSDMSGKWCSEIKDESDMVIKADAFVIRHNPRTNIVNGKITRMVPASQTHRKWETRGYLSGKWLILSFWSKPPQMSSGCIYVMQVEDFHYRGYYVRTTGSTPETIGIELFKAQHR